MIVCLPSVPGKACVRRIDWMISLIFRSTFLLGSCTSSAGSRRWRTSCWVMVLAPRAWPLTESSAADTMASGSKPVFVQKVLSSTAVVASTSAGESWSQVTGMRCSPLLKRASSVVPSRA